MKTSSTITESFPATVAKGKKAKGTVTVDRSTVASATGTVTIKKGNEDPQASATLKGGKVDHHAAEAHEGQEQPEGRRTPATRAPSGSSEAFTIKQK